MFEQNGDVIYGIFAALLIANVFMAILLFLGMKFFVRILNVPKFMLSPLVIVLCVVGAFGVNNQMFDAIVLLACGILGYIMIKIGFPIMPVVLGFILTPIMETNLRRGLMQTNGDILPFFTSPIAIGFYLLAVFSIAITVRKNVKKNRKANNDGRGVQL